VSEPVCTASVSKAVVCASVWPNSRLNKEITEILNLPLLKSRGEAASMSPVPMGMDDFDRKLAKEWERWGKVLKEHDIKLR
ncbi:MAG: hypothetical protein U0987_05110, partial [Afipia sp.]|nr:hypothetical protein [Afipia sp.]